MITHIVIWKMKEENKEENMKIIKEKLESLPPIIKEIKKLEVGINCNTSDAAYDLCLLSEFETNEDLESYQVNPNHVEVSKFVRSVITDRKVIDFER